MIIVIIIIAIALLTERKTPNMRVVSLSSIRGLSEDYSPGDSHSVALSKLLQRSRGGTSRYAFFG